jgi:glycosyltransferase involved in cell wall biosynthesis
LNAVVLNRLLMVAFHFPPLAGSSGIQRTLRFARHLPKFGWQPLVLTAHPRAYERTSDDQRLDAGPDAIVERAFALDSARHLAVRGRYPGFLARPDRWATWWLGAVPKGMAMIRRYRPAAIWSTYPIASAHKIAHSLHRLSGLPWIADFRDPMAQDGYPRDQKVWRSYKAIEQDALRKASFSVFVTAGAARFYRNRYPEVAGEKLVVIENGYDEDAFAGLESFAEKDDPLVPGTLTVLHSGIVYPSERDPTQLFQALRRLRDTGDLKHGQLRVRFRAPGHETLLGTLIEKYGLGGMVELSPPLPYRQALQEMLRADGLMVLQAANCNDQIPAKVYEYLRCRRPIIALTDPAGDTAALLRRAGIRDIAPLDSTEEIARVLKRFTASLNRKEIYLPDATLVKEASRLHRTRDLAGLLDRLSEDKKQSPSQ